MTRRAGPAKRDGLAKQLHAAVDALDSAEVSRLLAAGTPPDAWGIQDDLDLPLQAVARRSGDAALAIAKALIDAGADIDHQGDYGCAALHRALENRDRSWEMLSLLIRAGADAGLLDRDGLSPPENAENNGLPDAVIAMLDAGMSPNVRSLTGPLIWYCSWASPDLVRELLGRGADPEDSRCCFGVRQTPLQRAAEALKQGGDEAAFLDIAQSLTNAGADPYGLDPMPKIWGAFLLAREEHAALDHASKRAPASTTRSL